MLTYIERCDYMFSFKEYINNAISDLKFKKLTEVQEEVISNFSKNNNLLAKSKTGSGKTHAFLLPIFQSLNEKNKTVQAVIVSPTKELALQTYKFAQQIASFSKDEIDIRVYTGGTDRKKEIERLQSSQPQIVIGTPGRIKDLAIDENVLKIYTSGIYVVDEIDMTFDNGFQEDLDAISSVLIDAKMMFFSATMAENVLPFIKKYLKNPVYIDIKNTDVSKTKHYWIPLKHRDRYDSLKQLMNSMRPYLAIIFANTKEVVIDLAKKLKADGYNVGEIHGGLSARERKRLLQDANDLKFEYIVASDLAARGIDIDGASHIINYELPTDFEFYVHRSGRTGRMNYEGLVYSFYETIDNEYLDSLSKKGITPEYREIKNGELVEYRGRNIREERVKPKTEYQIKASKFVPLPKKVTPGYRKKRQAQIDAIAKKLKEKDYHNKWKKKVI